MLLQTTKPSVNIWHAARVLLLALALTACSTPEEKAAGYIDNGIALLDRGETEKAEIEFKNALQINENLPDALFGMVRIYEINRKWPETYAVLIKMRELAPLHVEARHKLARLLLASNQINQALADAQDILDMAPDDSRSYSLMASVQYLLEDHQGALSGANRALTLDPNNGEAFLVKARMLMDREKYQAAIAMLDRAIRSDPADVSPYLVKLQAHDALGNMGEIERIYQALIRQFPTEVVYKDALARHHMIMGDIDSAERVMQQIVESDPSNVAGKLRLVTFKYQYRSNEDAISLAHRYTEAHPENYAFRFLLGELHERNDAVDKAIGTYRKIIDDDGIQTNGLEARNKIALIEMNRGNVKSALELIEEVLQQDLTNKNGLLLRAEFQIADGLYDEALVNLRTVLRDSPESVRALQLSGVAYEALDSRDLAIETYRKAIKLNPGSPDTVNQLAKSLILRGDFAAADEILLNSIEYGNRSLLSVQMLAQVKLALGQWEQAEKWLKELENVPGQEAYTQQMMGFVLRGKDDQQASIEAFKRAHELRPQSSQPVNSLFETYVRNGQFEEAKKFLDSVLSVDADNLRANLLLAQLSLYENKLPAAIEQFERVLQIDPKSAATYHDLASIYVAQKRFGAAEKIIRQGLENLPGLPYLMIDLATIQELEGDITGAIETYELLLKNHPNQLIARNNLAGLLTMHGEDVPAMERARMLAADLRNSKIPQFRDTYAWTLVKSGINLDEAIVVLKGIVEENTNVGVYAYHLGEAYRQKGDEQMALAYLQKATELAGPDSELSRKTKRSMDLIDNN